MKIVAAIGYLLFLSLAAGCHSTKTTHTEMERRYPVKNARLVENRNGSGPKMYSAGTEAPAFIRKTELRNPGEESATLVKKDDRSADKLNPQKTGAKQLSMQDYNRYAYRKANSTDPGVPVTKAGGEETPAESDKIVK